LRRLHPLRHAFACLQRPSVALGIWIAVIAAWHVPAAYDGALLHETVHDIEHLSFIAAGVLVWMVIVDPSRRGKLGASQRLAFMLMLSAAGAVLAWVLILAPVPLYPAYTGDVRLFGISPVHDQQLAGIVMLVEQVTSLGICACVLAGLPATRASRLPTQGPSRRAA
jgi:cytochrome c oxidase assembly factor CtaG